MMDIGWACRGGHFAIYVNRSIALHTLNVYGDVYPLFPQKLGGEKELGMFRLRRREQGSIW